MERANWTFLEFGLFEITAGLFGLTSSIEDYRALFALESLMDEPAMIFAKGFSNGLLCIGICAVLAFFIQHEPIKAAFAGAFALMNAVAAWYCYTIEGLPTAYAASTYPHLAFALAFMALIAINLRRIK